MKLNIKYIIGVAAVATLGMVSCTDEIKFGNAFLEKAPGGTVTADEECPMRWGMTSIFSSTIPQCFPNTMPVR
mgnify:CR=1 FL=1